MVQVYTDPLTLMAKVDFFVSARNLKNLDTFSKSDPKCIIYQFNDRTRQWQKMGQTEEIRDNLNPNWNTNIQMLYQFEKVQRIKFEIIDEDVNGTFDLQGVVETTMGEVMGAVAQTYKAPLKMPNQAKQMKLGEIIVRAESLQESNHMVHWQV